jgi:class 3 adenylate cyclase
LQVNQLLRFALAGDLPVHGLSGFAEAGGLWLWCLTGVGLALCRLRFAWLLALMAGALATLAGIWGAVARQTEAEIAKDALQAVKCALAMGEQLRQLNAGWVEQELPTIAIRAGIDTGPMVAGSLGSSQRLEYAVIGDTVNIASRLESFDKDTPDAGQDLCRILIGETTVHCLKSQIQVEDVGRFKFKGKQREIAVYQVFGPADGAMMPSD